MFSKDLTGTRSGKLLVLGRGKKVGYTVYWECICDCGKKTQVATSNLKRTASCGCLRDGMKPRLTHGQHMRGKTTREYETWQRIKARCLNPNNPHYGRYGGRGITVCERWKNDFAAFFADMGPRPEGLSIDRIDNDGNYEPSNCRWATKREQSVNTSQVILIEFGGGVFSQSELAHVTGVPMQTLSRWRMQDAQKFEAKIKARIERENKSKRTGVSKIR